MKHAKDKDFLKQPVYKGGPKALRQFIAQNLRYPEEALQNKTEGTVFVNYTIDHTGDVIEAKVVSGIGHGCDEEALRLVRLLKYDVPKTRGIRVLFHKNIQIHFRLPKQKPAPASLQVNYITGAAGKIKEDKPEGGGYTYTIRIDS